MYIRILYIGFALVLFNIYPCIYAVVKRMYTYKYVHPLQVRGGICELGSQVEIAGYNPHLARESEILLDLGSDK